MVPAPELSPSAPPAKSLSRRTDESGFTLVEALIAMVIMTIALVSLAELLAVTLRMQQLGRNETTAARLAQDKLDQLMALNWDVEPSIQAPGGSLTSNVTNYSDTVPGYTRRWQLEAGPDGSANLRQITVRVLPDVTDRRTSSPYDLVSIIRRW